MPAGSVPKPIMNLISTHRSESLPIGWRLYRFGLVAGGLAWICIASTLCGCSSANGFAKNQSGRHYYNKGKYAAARNEFERALMDDPYNATYAYNVGKAMEKEGDISGAEQMYQHALTLNPAHQPAYHGMSEMMLAQGRTDEAQQLLTAWSQTQPYSAASHVEMASLQRKLGNYGAAEQEINTALQIRPKYRQALNERSRLYQVTGRPNKGGPFSALALTSRATQEAMAPQPGMMAATPRSSAALNMASTMPQRDPTMLGGVIQASYSQPQMSAYSGGMTPMMTNGPMQYQANMIPGQPMPEHFQEDMGQHGSPQPVPMQAAPMQAGPMQMQMGPGMVNGQQAPQSVPVPHPYQMPSAHMQPTNVPPQQFSQQHMGQPQQFTPQPMQLPGAAPMNMPVPASQPVELGPPVPVTQAYPGYQMPPAGYPIPETPNAAAGPASAPVMISSTSTVQAF